MRCQPFRRGDRSSSSFGLEPLHLSLCPYQSLLPVWVPTVRRGPPEKPGMVRNHDALSGNEPKTVFRCIAIVVAHPSTASATRARATVLSKKTANALLRHLHIGNSPSLRRPVVVEEEISPLLFRNRR